MVAKNTVVKYFSRLKASGKIGPAYLFIGHNPVLFSQILTLVNCKDSQTFCGTCWDCRQIAGQKHPDFLTVRADGVSIKIEQMHQARQFLSLRPFCASKKLLVIEKAEDLTNDSANAFLKTLEEPPKSSFIAITADSAQSLLPTIVSRCRKLYLPAQQNLEREYETESVLALLNGAASLKFKDRSQFGDFLYTFMVLLRDHLHRQAGSNKSLLNHMECEIILKSYSTAKTLELMRTLTQLYRAYSSVNESLAVNLIKNQIQL